MLDFLKKNFLFIVIAVAVVFILFLNNDKVKENDVHSNKVSLQTPAVSKEKEENVSSAAVVDVKGAVVNPGVYEVSLESRVNDVIALAGGFTKNADQTMVNLAQKVQDEMIILIPRKGDPTVSAAQSGGSGARKIRINYASQEEIETLNGIGPSKAQAIIQYRDEFGLFKSTEDLLEVPGIGEITLQNLEDRIQIP
ncbi:helix-hairpin-helix domain-containing protein [Virgibacillus ihumii]|uniref:helix-hairpin-helix domain-containing protein n=1 Tax=Virgibacillus ihumii TaxID=2686091 RepID=UPI00157BEB33|nr:helix-hairpin-helix domain-containing protein [Virgibacillus ihumii]